jgi:hypothetical protein
MVCRKRTEGVADLILSGFAPDQPRRMKPRKGRWEKTH